MLEDKDIARLKEIFVTREECNNNTNIVDNKLSKDNTRLAIVETYQRVTLWVLAAIGTGVISIVIKIFFGGGI